MSVNAALNRILARKEEKKSGGEHHHHKVEHHKSKEHEKSAKSKFTYPLMKLEEVEQKAKSGYTFKSATEADYKDKNATLVTIKLPKLGYTPFVVTEPPGSNKLDNGTEIKPPISVAKSGKSGL